MYKMYYFLCALLFMGYGLSAKAQGFFDRIMTIGDRAFGQSIPPSPLDIVENIVTILLGLVGTIFIVLIIYSGFKWTTSAGNETTISEAKHMIRSAVIGLLIVVLSYAISAFVIKSLQVAV